jgi:hypothetical protein
MRGSPVPAAEDRGAITVASAAPRPRAAGTAEAKPERKARSVLSRAGRSAAARCANEKIDYTAVVGGSAASTRVREAGAPA